MPKYDGVYPDAKGRWYFKVSLGRDPLTGRQAQVTKRGFATAADAARARRKDLHDAENRPRTPGGACAGIGHPGRPGSSSPTRKVIGSTRCERFCSGPGCASASASGCAGPMST
jgi:hypothetical protein